MDFGIYAADTSKTIYVRLRDSTTGLAKTGLVYNSAGAVASYILPGASRAAITLATLAAADSAWATGGFKEVDATNAKGVYRLDLPNAAIASGAYTIVTLQFTGVISEAILIPLHFHSVKLHATQPTGWAANLVASAGSIIKATVDTVTNTHTPTTTEFQADDVTEATADHYNGRVIIFTSGVLSGQATSITDYEAVGGIGQFTVVALTEAPSNNDTFIIV